MARVRWWLLTTWPYLIVVWIFLAVAIAGWMAGSPTPGHSDWYSPETVVVPPVGR